MSIDVTSLNPQQREAVLSRDTHLLVVAGPGSGKTRVLTNRVASLIDSGIPPYAILAVTFTNKAATEMRERLENILGEGTAKSVWAGTFHSICARMLRFEHKAANLPRDFQILDANDSVRVLSNIIMDMDLAEDKKTATQEARSAKDRISFAKNTLNTHSGGSLEGQDRALFEAYQNRLNQMKALDFDDLLIHALGFLSSDTEPADKWRKRFAHVLVDEFQDTNAVQLALVKKLTSTAYCTAVGDAAQSIYSWRGADHTSIQRFESAFHPSITVHLGENYRSTPEIVEVCQAILDAETTERYSLKLTTSNPSGAPVQLRECDDDRSEAAFVVAEIRKSKLQLADHAILVRTAAQTRSLEEQLLSSAIPYVVVGGLRFYERAEVRDALSYLRAASHPCDVVSLARASAVPRRGLGDKAMHEISSSALRLGAVLPALDATVGRGSKGAAELATILRTILDKASQEGFVQAVRYVTKDVLSTHFAKEMDGEARLENLDQLVAAAATFSTGVTPTGEPVKSLDGISALAAFLEHVALVSAADESREDCVQVMTMHAAKGREFPVVFVVGLEEDLMPHSKARHSVSDLAEERRLFFVACSRAMEKLALVWARQRYMFGTQKDQQRSRFVADILHCDLQTSSEEFRKAPWTSSHRSRPVGASTSWASRQPAPSTTPPRPRVESKAPERRTPQLRDIVVGETLSHPTFGEGTVVASSLDTVRIAFGDKERTLSVQMAPLSRP